jgi:lipopolysaccharide export system permease protein
VHFDVASTGEIIMKLVDVYVGKTVLSSILLVILMLAGLQAFILFVNQLGDLGKAQYGLWEAAQYVMLLLPYQVYLFFPMASLLGCLIGLGVMANHRELVVMRASGMSIWQVTLAVFKAALLLIILLTVLGETVIPTLSRIANDKKIFALSNGQTLRTSRGMWLRLHRDFINVGTVVSNTVLNQVYQFRFDRAHHLQLARYLATVEYKDGGWQALDVRETVIHQKNTTARVIPSMQWDVPLKPRVFGLGNREPDEMTLHELRQFLHVQKVMKQSVFNYQLDYWQRLFQPLSTLVMMMLSIPFIFGPLRSSTMGSKLLVGATVGFGFHILNRFFGPLSQVLQWSPLLAALGPTCAFALLGTYLMRRTD